MLELILKLKEETHRFSLDDLPKVAGRIERAALRLPHKSISREHARFFERDGEVHVADLNSSNGTFVNGKKVSLSPVREGDEIRLGALTFQVKEGSEASATPDAAQADSGISTEDGAAETAPKAPSPPAPRAAPASRPMPAAPEPDDGVEEFILPGDDEGPDFDSATGSMDAPPPSRTRGETEATGPAFPEPAPAARAGRPSRTGSAGRVETGEGPIKVKQDILQFHRVDAQKGRSFLKNDFSQIGGPLKWVIVLILVALCVGAFYLSYHLMWKITPDDLGSGTPAATEEDWVEEEAPDEGE
jgi:hypothetical protein